MLKRISVISIVAFALIGVLLLSACQQSAPPSPAKQEAKQEAKPEVKKEAEPKAQVPAATPAPAAAAKEKPQAAGVTVKVGMLNPPSISDSGLIIGIEKGYFKEEGINVETVPFDGAMAMIAPLSTNQLDVGGGMLSSGLFNAIGRQITLKIVADKASVPKGEGYMALVVRKDLVDSGAFKSDADLKGKTLAYNTSGGISDVALDKILKGAGLTKADIKEQVIPSMPDILTALANKAIDAGFIVEPSVTQGIDKGIIVRWKGFDEIYPNQQIAVLMYSPEFSSPAHADAANKFMVAYLRGVRDYNDAFKKGKNKQEVVSLLMKNTVLKDAALYERMVPVGLNPNGYINTEGVAYDVKWLTDNGSIKQPIDVKTVIDTQYVDNALKRLGEYK